jgi:hypothetical protein
MTCVEAASRAACLASRKLFPVLVAFGAGVQPAFSQEDAVRVLTGTVVAEESGEPLANVLVELESQGLQALTDSMGRFRIAGARPGIDTVRASYFNLAYSRMPVDLTSPGGHQVELTLSGAAFEVADLVVRIDATPREARRLARRIKAGLGDLISYDQMRRWAPARLMDLFRMTRRTRVRCVYGSCVVLLRGLGGYCRPAVFVNERTAPSWVLETTWSDDVQAVEIYWDPWVPAEFYRFDGWRSPTSIRMCGAINIWIGRF